MKKFKQTPVWQPVVIGLVISTVITLIFDYLLPTPWNFRSEGTWIKLFFVVMIYAFINAFAIAISQGKYEARRYEKLVNLPFVLPIIMVPAFFICMLTGAEIFNAKNYANIIQVEQVESGDAILSEKDAESIALMDTSSAKQLGDREIGAIENFSAFNVSDDYIQLNIKEDAVKVAPLEYIGLFKWMSNRSEGVTGYVSVSPTTMTADYVELEKGMKYIPSAYFHEDLNRHLHYQFPTLIYGNIHFEVDEEGNPYYVSSVFDKTIGVFGGEIVVGAIITDPVTGNSEYYDVADIPQWVDYVFPGDLICELYNVAYKNINGFWNGTSFGANTGCMQTTTTDSYYEEDGEVYIEAGTDYGYIAKDGDIYVYTGVTSMAADSSNLGFIMVNERTGQYKYFAVSSANEQSAMNAAQGEVQQYGYLASFPTLINVDNELAYIGVLKDRSGLVKMYYMVNVKDYGKVVVADSREACVTKYAEKLGLDLNEDIIGNVPEDEKPVESTPVEFTIEVLQYVDVDGNTYVYMGTSDGTVYKALFKDNEQLLFAKAGDVIKGTVSEGKLTITSITRLDELGNIIEVFSKPTSL
ncbi:MAG: hypothetical protein IJA07_02145 [Agathobacter sp.]|nr:hypothetical protein [Agathobacter sp.]